MKNDTFGWSRRFLVGGAAAATIASLYVAAVARGALKACSYEVEGGPSSELQSLIRIGNIYLNEHRNSGEPDNLDEAFFDETTRTNLVIAFQRRLLAIDHQIRDEFARYETVTCDGWVLAKSEARLCAAIAARVRRL